MTLFVDADDRELLSDSPAESSAGQRIRRRTGVEPVQALVAPKIGRPRRERARRRLLMLADGLALTTAWAATMLAEPRPSPLGDWPVVLACLPLWLLFNASLGLYDRDLYVIRSSTLDELPRIALSAFVTPASIFIVIGPLADMSLTRGQTLLIMALSVIAVCAFRSIARGLVRRRYEPERCLIVGSDAVARVLAEKIVGHPEYGVKLVGMVDYACAAGGGPPVHGASRQPSAASDHERPGREPRGENGAAVDDRASFGEICRYLGGVERVLIAFSSLSHEDLLEIVSTSKALGLKVSVVPRLFEAIGHRIEVDQVEGMTLLGLRGAAASRSQRALKRTLDLGLAILALLVLSPLLAMIALAVKLTSAGPMFFVQERIGRGSQPFRLYKFRTMVQDADDLKVALAVRNEAVAPMFKMADDPRVTRLGRHLRRLSLDELPQLWNVMRGEMSLVGPRPLVPSEDHYVIGRHRSRLNLAPGLTGAWQVLGRNAIPFHEMVKLDYMYVAEWSLWNDIKLILRTLPVVLRARGR